MSESFIIIIAVAVIFVFVMLIGIFRRYKRCPSDRILVVYGKVGSHTGTDVGRSAKCIHGGAAFIWPIIQDYSFLDLTPISIEVNLTNALSRQNIRVDVPSRFTVGISTEEGIMTNAAERLLGLSQQNIHDLAKDIIFGQLRLVVATMDIEEINNNRDKFLANVASNVEAELKKIGLKLINVNVTDIKDESGYIEALGKEAAAKAINDAIKSVAEKDRDGQIGQANALQDQRTHVAAANAKAVEGENLAKVKVAQSDASRIEKEAEAKRLSTAAEKVQSAKALEEAYAAEKEAEIARAQRDKSSQTADIVVPAEIDKQRVEIAAEAEAEMIRRKAKGEADAILYMKQAEAKGIYEVLTKQAQGLEQIVKAAGNDSKNAVLLLVADKLPELVKLQTEAIKNIKIDKVTVWDNGGNGPEEKTSTANFISGLYKSVPPLQEMFNMAGMELPSYLKGKSSEEIQQMAEDVKDENSDTDNK
ncbi:MULTISPECIES: flotillin family protein [Roseivirga]|jgi:flotillin|uniref:Flotillin n=1 Tax=Roseivirga spongicola TaxID=333140 RepID=A0A150X5D1_9BACT|nr:MULTISPECIES: flotillin family protein [Roseivirga]PWL32041.1 MAG: flotillin family protein [Roseivirga sp. XM-24bin3]KYG73894.1 flotillin [Roseivirga spongicola]MBO6495765.1 flotillin family protein [Roseivirga sp.]MBO6660186.1 flotillin family protein [Roseivirga sp.]MBO6907077.1 flotillin family protein [Roseivirga sp.]